MKLSFNIKGEIKDIVRQTRRICGHLIYFIRNGKIKSPEEETNLDKELGHNQVKVLQNKFK